MSNPFNKYTKHKTFKTLKLHNRNRQTKFIFKHKNKHSKLINPDNINDNDMI